MTHNNKNDTRRTETDYKPHPKNPNLANFFVQMGHAEHLGTGVRNLYHYAPIYLGAEPTITDDDMFCIRLNIAESKCAELTISATDRTTESSEKSSEKTWEKIVILIRANSNITIKEMAKEVLILLHYISINEEKRGCML